MFEKGFEETEISAPGVGGSARPVQEFEDLLGSFVFGTPEFPLSEVPLQEIVDRVAKGIYKAKPAAVFSFNEIREAQRLMESNQANGKIIVKL